MPAQGPLIYRRRLGQELRVLRESAGLHLEDAAERLECSVSKISRLENGRGIPKARDVRDLLVLYRVADQKVVDRLVRLAGDGRRQAWWQDYAEILSTNIDAFISLESEASNIRNYTQSAVPGMCQTEDYARALFRTLYPRDSDADIEKKVDLRMSRQVKRLERVDKPRVNSIIDEATVHRVVGDPSVMVGQLTALLEFSEQPDTSLRLHPFAAGVQLGIQCSFVVFTFEGEYDRNAVHVELPGGDRWLEQDIDVDRYRRLFEEMVEKSLDQSATRDAIHSLRRSYERRN